jgi:hypothetical protein
MSESYLLKKVSSAGALLLRRSSLLWMVAALVLLAFVLFRVVPSFYAQQPEKQIAAQIERLERDLKAAPASDQIAYELQRLQQARRALEAGYLYASLYNLQPVMVETASRQYTESKKELDKAAFDVFDREWQTVGPQLSQRGESLTEAKLERLPAAARALVQSSQEQSRSLYQSARLYGRETTTPYGLYYIGEAKGFMDFAVWTASLRFPRSPSWQARSSEKEIAELEREVIQAYDRPDANKQQGRFNEVSAQLKFADDLNQKGKPVAALQTYLEASLMFGLMDGPTVKPPDLNRLQQQGQELKARFSDSSQADESLGRMYWEIAENNLAVPASDKSSERATRQSAVILEKVLPRYFQYLASSTSATAPVAAAATAATVKAKVTVTLVRWPYT